MDSPATHRPRLSPVPGWLVHAFTASSAILAFLSLMAIEEENWRLALLWLLFALAVDGIDGTMARKVRIKERVPRIDGETLDLIVDYLTYVFIPAVFIWRAGLVPEDLALPLASLIQLSALYLFARRDMKSEDNYFRGFPGLWNLVAFYLFVAGAGPVVGAIVVVAAAILTFMPVLFVHPFRVTEWGRWLPIVSIIWGLVTLALLWPDWGERTESLLLTVSLALGALLLALGFYRTARGPRHKPA